MIKLKLNKIFLFALVISLTGCAGQITEKERNTVFVANEYLIYQNQRYQKFTELQTKLSCEKSTDVFLSPLVNTKPERMSKATAEFMMMCGEPEIITIFMQE